MYRVDLLVGHLGGSGCPADSGTYEPEEIWAGARYMRILIIRGMLEPWDSQCIQTETPKRADKSGIEEEESTKTTEKD